MIDLRPVGYVIGWLVAALGASMVLPMAADLESARPNARAFAITAIVTVLAGTLMALACMSSKSRGLTLQQSFLLATGIWVFFCAFGALPFWFGAPWASFTDAVFEAMSALSTTGSTVFVGLERLPPGTLLWRGMMQWFGGIGIVVVAMIFLPALKVGGMQLFRSAAFDTLGKILPRAGQIALSLTGVYLTLSFGCFTAYVMTGMSLFDALVHAMTTVSTGGMANYDASFSIYGAGAHYASMVFMILAALPFVRFIQLSAGSAQPLLRDTQIHAFLLVIVVFLAGLYGWLTFGPGPEPPVRHSFREVAFNVVSIGSGTGFAIVDYGAWGPFAMTLFFVLGLIGGCSGSTSCSVKIFRYQLLLSAISAEVKRLHSPNRVFTPRYEGNAVDADVMSSVIAFFMLFFVSLAIFSVVLVLLGLEPITAITGAAASLANVGPGHGAEIGPAGNFAGLPDAAKWILTFAMLAGRLEIMSVYVLFTMEFWRS